jgi:hypothetical protein
MVTCSKLYQLIAPCTPSVHHSLLFGRTYFVPPRGNSHHDAVVYCVTTTRQEEARCILPSDRAMCIIRCHRRDGGVPESEHRHQNTNCSRFGATRPCCGFSNLGRGIAALISCRRGCMFDDCYRDCVVSYIEKQATPVLHTQAVGNELEYMPAVMQVRWCV